MVGTLLFVRFPKILLVSLLLGGVGGAGRAADTSPVADVGDRGPVAEDYLKEKLALWQKRLNLQDWAVTVVIVGPKELRPGTLGNIRWDAEKKKATIRVLDAANYKMPFRSSLKDMEFTVVHELLHLELASLPRSEASHSQEEFAINRIAGALLQLDRKDEPAGEGNPLKVAPRPGTAPSVVLSGDANQSATSSPPAWR